MRITTRTYFSTWVALLVLTGLSFGISLLPLGVVELPIALAIAAAKGGLVAAFFMHLASGQFSYRFVLLVSGLFLAIMMAFTVADVATRDTGAARPPAPPPSQYETTPRAQR